MDLSPKDHLSDQGPLVPTPALLDTGVAAPRDALVHSHVVISSATVPAVASPVPLSGGAAFLGPAAPASSAVAALQVTVGPFDKLVSWLRAKRHYRLWAGFWLWRSMALIQGAHRLRAKHLGPGTQGTPNVGDS